jgi:ubiquinone/menaquinone biosynthesis C-methylase UbiE
MRFLTPNPRPFQTALAMVGAKPGTRVLFLGAGDGRVPAAVAGVTGLNGRTVVIDPSIDAEGTVERAAADAGTLVEFQQAPLANLAPASDEFDVVVVHQRMGVTESDPAPMLAEAVRVTRPGGRVIVMEGTMAAGWRERLQRPRQEPVNGDRIRDLLSAVGLRAARVLALADGVTYVEGAKPRTP